MKLFDLLKLSEDEAKKELSRILKEASVMGEKRIWTEEEWRAKEALFARMQAEAGGPDYIMEEPPASCKKNVKPSSPSK